MGSSDFRQLQGDSEMNADRAHEALPVPIEPVIVTLRGEKVILDSDLAAIYGVKTGVLNRAVKRHRKRFPEDFIFQLSAEEVAALRCQSGTSKRGPIRGHSGLGRGGRRYRPYAFSEHGAIMAATVLSSQRAVQMSVFVVRAFVRLRQLAGMNRAMAEKLAELERRVSSHDRAIRSLVQTTRQLMAPPEKARRSIGFRVEEGRPAYGRPRGVGRGKGKRLAKA
jgi:hypothetical protein